MKLVTIILAAVVIAASAPAFEPAGKLLSRSLDSIIQAATPTAQVLACRHVYVWSAPAIDDEGNDIIEYFMPGDIDPIGHVNPKETPRWLKRAYTNMPPGMPFTLMRRVFNDGTEDIVKVER